MQTDQELYQAFLEGEISSFEALVLRHRHNLVYFILQYTRSFESAEDIAQEVFAYIYIHPRRYDPQYAFKTFLFTLGKRRAIDWLRQQKSPGPMPLEEADAQLADCKTLEDLVLHRETMEELAKAMRGLKEAYRQVLWLTEWNDFSMADAAEILGKKEGTVKVLAHRARKALRKAMGKEGAADENR